MKFQKKKGLEFIVSVLFYDKLTLSGCPGNSSGTVTVISCQSDSLENFLLTASIAILAEDYLFYLCSFQSYLGEKGLVHRDLAARNVLVGHGKLLKIADFGLMREVYHEVYEVQKQKKLPVKWMAPESIYEQIFTFKSDV